jgi:uncharacterized protein
VKLLTHVRRAASFVLATATGSTVLGAAAGAMHYDSQPGEGVHMPPTRTNGKVCYIEIPAADIQRSAGFYGKVFGWRIRKRSDGRTAFDDTTGEVSGTWITGRAPSSEVGMLLYIMVDNAAVTVDAIVANGGAIVQPIGADAPEITARFRDPAGNVIGIYQEPVKKPVAAQPSAHSRGAAP